MGGGGAGERGGEINSIHILRSFVIVPLDGYDKEWKINGLK